jgi:hypothetical protein
MAKAKSEEVLVGKFDILATYAYVKAILDGEAEPDAKVHGIVAAMMGAKAKIGYEGLRDHFGNCRAERPESDSVSVVSA